VERAVLIYNKNVIENHLYYEEEKMKLYVMRHGEAESIGNSQGRPLNQKGIAETEKIANFLAINKVTISQIFHSQKLRTKQTAAVIANRVKPEPLVKELSGLLPNDPVDPIVDYCNEWQEDTLIIGHLPFIVKFTTKILIQTENPYFIDFHTAAILCLEKIGPYQWCCAWFISPNLLVS
jgi:phosphohistidine phosphatase